MKLIAIYDQHYAVICSCCDAKVMDPDKKINQVHLKGKCPTCGQDSKEYKKNKKNKKHKHQKKQRANIEVEDDGRAFGGWPRFIV
jgi:transcription initiation factor IIE alpha subunit